MNFEEWKRLRKVMGKNTPISPEEIWNSAIAEERKASAIVCRELAESHKRNVGGECDTNCDIVTAFETCADAIFSRL